MHPTLFYIPSSIGGMPLFGFGLLFVVWAVFSVGIMIWLAWRQGFDSDTWSHLPLLLIIGAAIVWLLPVLTKEGGLPIRSYGVMLLLAVLSGTALAVQRAKRMGLHPDMGISVAFWMFVPGIIGARVFYVTEYWSQFQRSDLLSTVGALLNVAEGGLVVYGSLIGGLLGLVAFSLKYRLPLLAVGDLLAPCFMLGLALGRIGCLLNGCCFGGLCILPWAVTFPAGSPPYEAQVMRGQMYGFEFKMIAGRLIVSHVDASMPAAVKGLHEGDTIHSVNGRAMGAAHEVSEMLLRSYWTKEPVVIRTEANREVELPAIAISQRSLAVHPTQAYATIDGLVLLALALAYDPFRRRNGEVFALILTLYPINRFLTEMIRTDEPPILNTGMTISQNVSLVMLVLAAGVWVYVSTQPKGLWKAPAMAEG